MYRRTSGVGEGEGETEGEGLPEGAGDSSGPGEPLGAGLWLGVAEGLAEGLGLTEGLGLPGGSGVAVGAVDAVEVLGAGEGDASVRWVEKLRCPGGQGSAQGQAAAEGEGEQGRDNTPRFVTVFHTRFLRSSKKLGCGKRLSLLYGKNDRKESIKWFTKYFFPRGLLCLSGAGVIQ